MRYFLFMLILIACPAEAGNLSSAYTKLDAQEDCTSFAKAEAGNGDWVNLVCRGYKGYPVFVFYGDLRESINYGFLPINTSRPRWESFAGFNNSSGTIEWRLEAHDGEKIPFATIHRWMIEESGNPKVEVLVVEKVGQVSSPEGCVVGYVVASGNQRANVQARDIADTQARNFKCGTDDPTVRQNNVALPNLMVSD
jgi:hypothetical protein